MDVLESNADLKEKSPYFIFLQWSLILKLQELVKVSIVAILHYYVKSAILYERLFVAHDKRVYEFAHNGCFIDSLYPTLSTLFLAF